MGCAFFVAATLDPAEVEEFLACYPAESHRYRCRGRIEGATATMTRADSLAYDGAGAFLTETAYSDTRLPSERFGVGDAVDGGAGEDICEVIRHEMHLQRLSKYLAKRRRRRR